MFMNKRTDKMWYIHIMKNPRNEKKQMNNTSNNMDKAQKHYIEF